jgi:hypothetical protein
MLFPALVDDLRLDADAEPALHETMRPIGLLAFEPQSFFVGSTEGAGVVRDPFGRVLRRCRIATEGCCSATQGALRLDETFTYDDGEVDVWRWVMTPGRDGRYVAAEARAGAGIAGETRGGDYLINFSRPKGSLRGAMAPRYRSRFTLLTPDTALRTTTISVLGVPVGDMSAIYRRVGTVKTGLRLEWDEQHRPHPPARRHLVNTPSP